MPSKTAPDINALTDREIVAALLRRDRDITEAYLYRKCYPLFKYCFDHYYTDCTSCTEFINEIYIYLMTINPKTSRSYMQSFSFRCSLTHWLRIVAQTYCHQLFRKKADILQESLDDGDRFWNIQDSIDVERSKFDHIDVNRILQAMPNARYRELIRLRYLEELDNELVAKILGLSMDNYYNKHLLAKRQFITSLKKEGLL